MTLLLIYVGIALGISFVCSILEAVLLSITPTYVASKERLNNIFSRQLTLLKSDVERPLSAILTLNTIAHTVGATGAGAQALIVFGDKSVAIFSSVLTLAILILSEIIPKSIGASYWRQLAPLAVRALPPMIALLTPFVWLSAKITNLITPKHREGQIKKEELHAISELGYKEGILEQDEFNMLANFLRFGNLAVQTAMTPRPVAAVLDHNISLGDVREELLKNPPFSRLPLIDKEKDQVTGYVLRSQILMALIEDPQTSKPVADLVRPIIIVTADTSLKTLFRNFLEQSEHIAVVVNEYGAFLGIITLEDLVETMLGLEIKDEGDTVEDLQNLARRKWKKRAERSGIVLLDEPPISPVKT